MNTELTERRNAKIDLIVIAATLVFLPLFMVFQSKIKIFVNNESINILIRTIVISLIEFWGFGFGPALVMIYRKEKFKDYGLITNNLVLTVALSFVCCLPYLLLYYMQGRLNTYCPFHTVWIAKHIYSSGFPENIIGITLVALSWGFWEGFSYVVICEKINKLLEKKESWFNPGAVICAIICIAIHGAIGITPEGIFDAISCFVLISGMLMVKEKTGNAWGCVLIFVLFWNAF